MDVLCNIYFQELIVFFGIGFVKVIMILVVVELGKWVFQSCFLEKMVVDSFEVVAIVLSQDLMWQIQEYFVIVMLDVKNCLLVIKVIIIGIVIEILIYFREIFWEVIKQGVIRLIVVYNYFFGGLELSLEDIRLIEFLFQGA